jgi:hypothetical protein
MAILTAPVILNLFQDLPRAIALLPHGMLKQVQHDECFLETIHA